MTNRHARARTWTPRLRSHGWQWCLGPQLKEDNPLEVGQHSTQPILTSAKPFWRQGPKIELCRTPNPNVAMGAKRACPFEEELRDLLTYTCPYSGNKRCPPLYKENIKFHILLQWWYVFVWCIFPISAIWVVCGFCLRKIIFMHACMDNNILEDWSPIWQRLQCLICFYISGFGILRQYSGYMTCLVTVPMKHLNPNSFPLPPSMLYPKPKFILCWSCALMRWNFNDHVITVVFQWSMP